MPYPRKRFGQHFLSDQMVVHQIVDALAPAVGDHLVEIGPGQGALTLPVMKRTHHLEVIEIDKALIPILRERCAHQGDLKIYEADVLDIDLHDLKKDKRLLRVFGNLPYNISTPLIFHLLQQSALICDMLFMLQREVAERLVAKPDTKQYGRLSVMTQYHCQIDLLFEVSPHAFFPPPQVYSSVVRMIPYQQKPHVAADYHLLETIVRAAFNQRRKTIRNSLKDFLNDDDWAHLAIHPHLRAENLQVKDFVMLANVLSKRKLNGSLCNR
jgi:16S rRNA (adenine1518-N6/adenine1519-N6)-dimethyltransferase